MITARECKLSAKVTLICKSTLTSIPVWGLIRKVPLAWRCSLIFWLSLNQEYLAGGMLCWSRQRSCTNEPVTAALGISQDGVCGGTGGQDITERLVHLWNKDSQSLAYFGILFYSSLLLLIFFQFYPGLWAWRWFRPNWLCPRERWSHSGTPRRPPGSPFSRSLWLHQWLLGPQTALKEIKWVERNIEWST